MKQSSTTLCLTAAALAVLAAAALPGRTEAQDTVPTPRSRVAAETAQPRGAQPVTLNVRNTSLEEVLTEIGRQSGMPVMFGEDVFQGAHRVTVRLRQAPFQQAVAVALEGTGLVAVPAPGRGVLVRRGIARVATAEAVADTVIGRVIEAGSTAVGVGGAEVVVAGRRVAVTDGDGRFVVVLEPGTHEVTINKIGYGSVTRAVTVPTDAELVIELMVQPLTLTELVVTGVSDPIEGVKLPFTVGRISGEPVTAVPSAGTALGAIQGKIAGVSIVSSTGQPGTQPEILLRTPTSIQKTNDPMIIVDGVVLASTYTSPAVDIASLDIESIEVVKGAAAASLYGSRAANGVVQIRTRRGAALPEGETRITARSEYGTSAAPTGIAFAQHHFFVTNEQGQFLDATGAVTDDPSRRVIKADRMMDAPYGVPLYDNVRTFFRPGQFMTNSVTISQNAQATNFALSLVNSDQQGSLENNDGFEQNSVRLNVDHRLTDDFFIGASAYHSRGNRDVVAGNPYFNLLSYSPEVDLGRRGPDGQFLQQPDPTITVENPIWFQSSRDVRETRLRTLGNLNARYTPFGWLSFSGDVSYDRTDLRNQNYTPKGTPLSLTTDNPSSGALQKTHVGVDAINASLRTSLIGVVGDITARLNLTALMERETNDFMLASGTDFWVPDVPALNVAANRTVNSSLTQIRANGFLAQLGIDYGERWIGDLLVRRDGSSLFGADARWQTYYRGAVAYRVSEEAWFDIPQINELKLRYARGTAGGRPSFTDRFETWTVLSSGAVSRSALGNRNLTPSLTTEQEVGIDLIAFDRYSLQLSYIDQVSEAQLISVPMPSVTGFTAQVRNAGRMTGHTYEATFEARIVDRPSLAWSSSVVADRSRSRIEEWGRSCFVTLLVRYCAGESMSDIWGRRLMRGAGDLPAVHANSSDHFQVNDDGFLVPVGAGNSWRDGLAEGLWGTNITIDGVTYAWGVPVVVTDENGLAAVDRIGSSAPDVSLGWLNTVNWRGFDVYTHMHAQIGGQVYNNTRQRLYNARRHGDLDQSGKPDELKKPEPYYNALYNLNAITDHFLEDGSFLKLREVAVRYNVSREQLARLGLGGVGPNRVALGISGRNLLTLSGYSGFDPEVGSVFQRYDSFVYPNTRAFTGTIEITF